MGPNAAGAYLPDNKPRKRFNYKSNASKGFEGSSRGTFLKVPLEQKTNSPTNQNLKLTHVICQNLILGIETAAQV
jgi:hypothetical protein